MGYLEENITKETSERLSLSMSSMGYRQMKDGKWGKPFGRALALLEIDKSRVIVKSIVKNGNGACVCWKSSGFSYDNETSMEDLVYSIADAEMEIEIQEACRYAWDKCILSFSTPVDLFNIS